MIMNSESRRSNLIYSTIP